MADENKVTLQEDVVDDLKSAAAIGATVVAFANEKSRAVILKVASGARALGGMASRMGAQLLDRTIVSVVLRPVLVWSALLAMAMLALDGLIVYQLVPLLALARSPIALAVGGMLVLVAVVPQLIVLWNTRAVKHYSDFDGARLSEPIMRRMLGALLAYTRPDKTEAKPLEHFETLAHDALRTSIQRVRDLRKQAAATDNRALLDQVILAETNAQTTLSGMIAQLRSLHREVSEGSIAQVRHTLEALAASADKAIDQADQAMVECQKAAEFNQELEATLERVHTLFTTLQAEAEGMRFITRDMEKRVGEELAKEVNEKHGPSGYASRATVVMLVSWLAVSALNILIAVNLRTWYKDVLHYPMLTGTFIVLATIAGAVFLGLGFAVKTFVEDMLKAGAALIGLGGELVVGPLAEVYVTGIDKNNRRKVIPTTGLVGKVSAWLTPFDMLTDRVLQVLCGFMGLLAVEHDLFMFIVILGVAVVFLCGWKFLALGEVESKPAVRFFVILLFSIMLDMLIARIVGSSIYEEGRWFMDKWELLNGAETLAVFLAGVAFLGLGLLIKSKATHHAMQNLGLYVGGTIFVVCFVISVCSFLGWNQRADSTYHHTATTDTHTSAPAQPADPPDAPHPDRSPSRAESLPHT